MKRARRGYYRTGAKKGLKTYTPAEDRGDDGGTSAAAIVPGARGMEKYGHLGMQMRQPDRSPVGPSVNFSGARTPGARCRSEIGQAARPGASSAACAHGGRSSFQERRINYSQRHPAVMESRFARHAGSCRLAKHSFSRVHRERHQDSVPPRRTELCYRALSFRRRNAAFAAS